MVLKKKNLFEIIFLIAISALVYLPNIGDLAYFKDDWYYIYDGYIAGAKVFHYMFSIDRPARGYLFEFFYSLFGPQPLPYHISAFIWRAISAIGALWLFKLMWPKDRIYAFVTALLFALYPGYSWWVSAVEYQPHIASLALQVVSIALTLKAIQASGRIPRLAYLMGAILTGWIYIALVDYAIGMEIFRFLCVFVLVSRDVRSSGVWRKLHASLRAWLWNSVIPLGYIWWSMFVFNNERKATDLGLQLEALFNAPLQTVSNWFLHYSYSLWNLSVLAWVNQPQRLFLRLPVREMDYGYAIAAIVLLMVFLAASLIKRTDVKLQEASPATSTNLVGEALLIGVAGMMLGILPIILVNRYINIGIFSHYGLPASLTAAIVLTGLIYVINSEHVRFMLFCAAIVFAVLTHYSIPKHALIEENALMTYWWQVSWRVPGLRPDTTLVTLYPYGIGSMDDGFMETANMIYFPDRQEEIPVRYPVSAIIPTDLNVDRILTGHRRKKDGYRSHTYVFDYGNVLVLSQPTPESCVRVIDGTRYLLSESDPENIGLIAPQSKIENIRVNVDPRIPQEFAFGPEPAHNWCFYFEKADLAVQKLDWREAARLGDEAFLLNLHPQDQVEWFPFLQAYAMVEDFQKLNMVSMEIKSNDFLIGQVCLAFQQAESALAPTERTINYIDDVFCKSN